MDFLEKAKRNCKVGLGMRGAERASHADHSAGELPRYWEVSLAWKWFAVSMSGKHAVAIVGRDTCF